MTELVVGDLPRKDTMNFSPLLVGMKIPTQSLQMLRGRWRDPCRPCWCYLLGIEAMTSGWVGFGQLVLVVAGMFLACTMERKAVAGAFTFGEAFVRPGRRGDQPFWGWAWMYWAPSSTRS